MLKCPIGIAGGKWKMIKDIIPGDLILHDSDGFSELRLVISLARRQEKNRTLWGLVWINVGGKIKYSQGWFWSDSEQWVVERPKD